MFATAAAAVIITACAGSMMMMMVVVVVISVGVSVASSPRGAALNLTFILFSLLRLISPLAHWLEDRMKHIQKVPNINDYESKSESLSDSITQFRSQTETPVFHLKYTILLIH